MAHSKQLRSTETAMSVSGAETQIEAAALQSLPQSEQMSYS